MDADGEVGFGSVFYHLIEDSLDHGWGKFFRGKPVPSTNDARGGLERRLTGGEGFIHSCYDILIEGFAKRARLFCAVKDRNRLHGGGQHCHEVFNGEGSVQAYIDHTNFTPLLIQIIYRLFSSLGTGTHGNDYFSGVGGSGIVEQVIVATGQFAKAIHRLLYDRCRLQVEGVGGFPPLEEDIGVLRSTTDHRALRRKSAGAHSGDEFFIDHGFEVVFAQALDFVDLGGGAETVEEMHEGYARFEGGSIGDQRLVLRGLHGI